MVTLGAGGELPLPAIGLAGAELERPRARPMPRACARSASRTCAPTFTSRRRSGAPTSSAPPPTRACSTCRSSSRSSCPTTRTTRCGSSARRPRRCGRASRAGSSTGPSTGRRRTAWPRRPARRSPPSTAAPCSAEAPTRTSSSSTGNRPLPRPLDRLVFALSPQVHAGGRRDRRREPGQPAAHGGDAAQLRGAHAARHLARDAAPARRPEPGGVARTGASGRSRTTRGRARASPPRGRSASWRRRPRPASRA